MNRKFVNNLLIERKEAVKEGKADIIRFLDEMIHDEFMLLRKQRRRKEKAEREHSYVVVNHSTYCDPDDLFWEKRLYPGQRWSEEEMEEYVRESWEYVRVPWDCSGETFTQDINVFNTPAGVVVYHFKALDI